MTGGLPKLVLNWERFTFSERAIYPLLPQCPRKWAKTRKGRRRFIRTKAYKRGRAASIELERQRAREADAERLRDISGRLALSVDIAILDHRRIVHCAALK